jgi:sugar transferase (PEP-CTERM/EpsH1 system associated)
MPELLFLSHRVPFPPDKGEKIRAWHLLNHLAKTYRIHLGCLVDDARDRPHLAELGRICSRVGGFEVRAAVQKARAIVGMRRGKPLTADIFFHPELARWVKDSLAASRIDTVVAFSSGMVSYADGCRAPVRVLDMVDVDSEKWRDYASNSTWPLRALYHREADTLLALERRAAAQFDATLFVSEAEARRFAALAPECRQKIGWVENGVDLELYSPLHRFERPFPGGTTNLVFTGTMDYWPNGDAVGWFARRVMPLLAARHPQIHFHIVGAKPSRPVQRLALMPNVHVTGRVPDVRPYIAHADAVVAPLKVARGIQNKVLEAMAMGRPVVATPEAFEGLRAIPEQELLVRATPEEFSRGLADIIEGRCPGLGAAARSAVERDYAWAQNLKQLDAVMAALQERSAERTAK